MPPIPYKKPDYMDPSVTDSWFTWAKRQIGTLVGADDPAGSVMGMVGAVEVPAQKAAGKVAQKLSEVADSYRGSHTAPLAESGAPLHDLTGGGRIYPDDVYGPMGARYYGTARPGDEALFAKFRALKGKPDAKVTAYRAVPKDAPDTIQHGDWVTVDRKYAKEHGEAWLKGDYKILKEQVPAKSLFTNADSPYEFGIDRTLIDVARKYGIPLAVLSSPTGKKMLESLARRDALAETPAQGQNRRTP